MSSRATRWLWLALVVCSSSVAITLFLLSANPLLTGAAALIASFAGLLHLRVDHRTLRRALREREATIRGMVDGASDAIMTVDSRGVVISFNLAAERMFGWPSTQIVGQTVDVLFNEGPADGFIGRSHDRLSAPWGNPVVDGKPDITARRQDGSAFPVVITYAESQRKRGRLTAIVRDVTEYRHNAEALRAANALLETKVIELEERTRVITILGEMSNVLQATMSPAEAYTSIADYARQLFPRDAGALCVVDLTKNAVEIVASWGEQLVTRPLFAPEDCRALREGQRYVEGRDDADGTCSHLSGPTSARFVCLAILSQGAPQWTAHFRWCSENLGASDGSAPAAPFRTKLAAAFSEQVGLALTNLRLKEMLRAQAIHDPLTGLHNRRFLDEALHRELLRAARRERSVGVLMLDLDHFKGFNDAHGHAAGDALLRAFAAQLRSDTRAEDIVCRYGGEEFTVVLPDTTLDQALVRAEQIRERLREIVIEFRGRPLQGMTISIGVASMPEHGRSADALLRAADAALYAAKVEGRNRTKPAAPLCAESSASLRASRIRDRAKRRSSIPL